MRVKFSKAYTVKAKDGESYAEGQTVDFDDDASAQHFINRGVAEEVAGKRQAPADLPDDGSPDFGADGGKFNAPKAAPDAATTANTGKASGGKK